MQRIKGKKLEKDEQVGKGENRKKRSENTDSVLTHYS